MNRGTVQMSGDDLHGVSMRPISTDGFEMSVASHQHLMPA